MKHLWCVALLQVVAVLALNCTGSQGQAQKQPNEVEMPIKYLYTQVVAIHPVGIPKAQDMKSISPYLSQRLLHRIDLANSCQADFFRQYPKPDLKPAFEWLELGLFSGDEEQASPSAFQIESTQLDKGEKIRVYVKLTYNEPPPYSPWIWRVAAIVIQENGQYVVDDIVYLKDKMQSTDELLSERLSAGCDGPRWVGFGHVAPP